MTQKPRFSPGNSTPRFTRHWNISQNQLHQLSTKVPSYGEDMDFENSLLIIKPSYQHPNKTNFSKFMTEPMWRFLQIVEERRRAV